jgi:hypothetical protein
LLIRQAFRYILYSPSLISAMERAMVANSGATPGSEPLRPLNPPIPVEVRENARQLPVVVRIKGRWRRVVSIDEVWSIDEEWWRQRPIVRMYYRVNMDEGRQMTVFRDMLDGAWYRQNA